MPQRKEASDEGFPLEVVEEALVAHLRQALQRWLC